MSLALLGMARGAEAEVVPRLALHAPLALRVPRPQLSALSFSSLRLLPLVGAPSGETLTVVVRSDSTRGSAGGPSDDLLFAPLRGAWAGVALRRCGSAACDAEAPRPTVETLSAQVGVISVLTSAFIPEGQLVAMRSEALHGTVHFTPTTFGGTGAGLRVWGDFW